jgi:hypothetical protein
MKLSRRRKNAKRVKYTRCTKYRCKKYKNKQTYRKHSHKLKKNKRVMRGGDGETEQLVQQTKPYEFTPDENLSVYKSSGELTYKRKDAWTNKTKAFQMTLEEANTVTLFEKKKKSYIQLSPTGGNDTSRDSELNDLTRSNKAISIRQVYRQVFAVFKLEMMSTDEKKTNFIVYFKVDTAVARDTRDTRDRYLKAFITYSPDTNFDNRHPVIETPFMKVTDSPAFGGICYLFKTRGLAIEDSSKKDTCYFSCEDNEDFFWKLTYTMVKFAIDIELKDIQSANQQILNNGGVGYDPYN